MIWAFVMGYLGNQPKYSHSLSGFLLSKVQWSSHKYWFWRICSEKRIVWKYENVTFGGHSGIWKYLTSTVHMCISVDHSLMGSSFIGMKDSGES